MHFMPRSDLSEARLIPICMSVSFNELKNFMDPKTPRKRGEKKMQMAHIYQPVMIKTLLQSNDKASVDKIAREINQHDQALAVMAVDNLPSELPKDSSKEFGDGIINEVLPYILEKDDGRIKKATIAENGDFLPSYKYLKNYINTK